MGMGGKFILFCMMATALGAEPFHREALVDSEHWFVEEFKSQFRPLTPGSQISHRRWPEATPFFGVTPHLITAKFESNQITSINFLFLDSGTHFGYVAQSQAKQVEATNRESFQALFADIKNKVTAGLEDLAGPPSRPKVIGNERMLKQMVTYYQSGNVVARFHAIDEQLIKVTFFKQMEDAATWMPPEVLEMRSRERRELYAKRVHRLPNGDIKASDIPLLPQGDRAYCGISSLAMAMQYLGLNIDTEDYAAAALVRYGSTRGSRIREVYSEAAEEGGFRMSRSTRFDFDKVKKSIDAGIPVLVWRRWTQERDFIHTAFARRFKQDPTAQLPKPDSNDRAMWPGKKAFTHATVVTGYNEQRREVIFTESWSERERDRRMRVEEMEGTAYYTFVLRL